MGKPFEKELAESGKIYEWAATAEFSIKEEDIVPIFHNQTLFVGSGGSLSACHLGAMLHQRFGHIAKAITPLELIQSKEIICNSNIVLLSASGRNSDILKACEIAKTYGAKNLLAIIMSTNSALAKKVEEYEYSNVLELNIPSGKDGFLATNSLIAFFTLLLRLYKVKILPTASYHKINNLDSFLAKLPMDFTLTVLYSGWATSIAYDIESKFSEAGLGNVLITDYRNFGHGRHNWFDKKSETSAVIQLITPEIKSLAEKTVALLPKQVPILKLETENAQPSACIDLLMQSFSLVNAVGKKVGIDPGRPGVPDYGSKLYHLSYPKGLLPQKEAIKELLWLKDKTGVTDITLLSDREKENLLKALTVFRKRLSSEKFGGLVFDYDGTLCTSKERFLTPSNTVKKLLNDFLSKGYVIGIVTGRGKSVKKALRDILLPEYYEQVIIGYYNGSQIGLLSDDALPKTDIPVKENLVRSFNYLTNNHFLKSYYQDKSLSMELKAHMIEIQIKKDVLLPLKNIIKDLLVIHQDINTIKILESSHSIDVIDCNTSKLEVIPHCESLAKQFEVRPKFVCIGDRGSWPGNDYQLLSTDFSLSVDQSSHSLDTCWNLASPGNKGVSATREYLNHINFHKGYFNIEL